MAVIDPERWRALEPLLDRALGMSTEEQAVWLSELAITSPGLAAELGALLMGETAADRQGFLVEPLELRLSGLELGAYALERPIGQGGMGSVWLARRIDGRYEGYVAIKLLNLALLTTAGQERFRREGSLLARLAHPGIARLLDAGVANNGQPYLVLEHVDGLPIDKFAETNHLDLRQRVHLVEQVLTAVGHAHANLVVHRDLKPNNILVTGNGVVKLLDFGIAKLLGTGGSAENSTITVEGGRALTPEFAAPEQVRGETITTATDVYSLGTLLYLLVSGRHPTAHGCRTPADAVRRLLEVEPAHLALGDLDTILAKALRKDASERYQTVAAFGDDLARYLRDEPVSARPDSAAYRTRKFLRRHRGSATSAVLTLASLVAATVFSLHQMREARLQRDAAMQDSKRARATVDMQLVLSADSRTPDGRPLSTGQRIALSERILMRQFGQEPWLVAEVMSNLALLFYQSGERDTERQILSRAREIAGNAGAQQQIALTSCLRVQSFAYDDMLDSARIDLEDAKLALGRVRGPLDREVESICLDSEGRFLIAEGRGDAGVALTRRAVALANQDSTNGTRRLGTMNDLAEALRLAERMREAVPFNRQVLRESDSRGYGDTQVVPNLASFLDGSLWELGEPAAADSDFRPLVREQESIHGVGNISSLLAFLYARGKLRLGQLDSAETWLGRSMRDTSKSAEWWRVRLLPAALTELRVEQGRFEEAQRASAQLPLGTPGRRAVAALLRARIRRASGDVAGASSYLESELRALSTGGRPALTLFALPFVAAGEWRLASGDAHSADSLAQLAWTAAAIDSLASERSGFAGRADLLRAHALRALGNAPAARASVLRATVALANGYGESSRWTREARALRDSLERR